MRINRERLWKRQNQIGQIGAVPEGGVSRFAWTKEYKQACQLLIQWMEEAGLKVHIDTVGNIYKKQS